MDLQNVVRTIARTVTATLSPDLEKNMHSLKAALDTAQAERNVLAAEYEDAALKQHTEPSDEHRKALSAALRKLEAKDAEIATVRAAHAAATRKYEAEAKTAERAERRTRLDRERQAVAELRLVVADVDASLAPFAAKLARINELCEQVHILSGGDLDNELAAARMWAVPCISYRLQLAGFKKTAVAEERLANWAQHFPDPAAIQPDKKPFLGENLNDTRSK